MNEALPSDLEYVRTTDTFDEGDHPAGLLRDHHVAAGVWGRLVVHTGELRFVFEDDADHPIAVSAGTSQVIPPSRRHHVEFTGPVTFAIEFHRERARATPTPGDESTGLATS